MSSAIVFGPTGGVGAQVARAASEYGVKKVYLAMRDPSKKIQAFDSTQSAYERVQADLTKPESVEAAVRKTGAKHAFIYLVHGSTDGMKSAVQALKAGGVDFVVFLSSFSVQGDIRAIKPDDYISYTHAQVEIYLEELYGKGHFVALRPAYFATNLLPYSKAISSGTVRLYHQDLKVDCITPVDIGNVAAYFLAHGPQQGTDELFLCGPNLLSFTEATKTIGKNAFGKDIATQSIDADAAEKMFHEEHGHPAPVAKMLIKMLSVPEIGFDNLHKPGVANVRKYSGKEPLQFGDWVSQNKELFV